MTKYHIEPLPLRDAFLWRFPKYKDARGFFVEAFRIAFSEREALPSFVQDNLSHSIRGVLRGLHFQKLPHPQAKLITVLRGKIRDVIVDLRPTSPTYKRWVAVELSEEDNHFSWLYVPVGFAHGFYVLSDEALVWYKCSDYYDPALDAGLRWNDPTLGIAWEISEAPILSEKDASLPFFDERNNPFSDL
ncbi:MAG: dTDP-4-dehydrorhamnose 3,5-epimerase [Bacteroidia bacterium]|nr:dTDP-4-dehydrorhamnose 3,5-epimerase [Bacteroidia bacterium]MCX7652640.1 dTDP-4-dehydrorhamnose 3,5-epimerase [Bacteroidia bacterium]MDW8417007.1 dTDP-4-dehydrorhamnose 3,5-epimerase [Bacteroidia bacterium]